MKRTWLSSLAQKQMKYLTYKGLNTDDFNKFYPWSNINSRQSTIINSPNPSLFHPKTQRQITFMLRVISAVNNRSTHFLLLRFTKTSTDNSNTNYSTENSSQSLLNLSNLKKQLDSLLKQTDYIENSKRNSVKVVN